MMMMMFMMKNSSSIINGCSSGRYCRGPPARVDKERAMERRATTASSTINTARRGSPHRCRSPILNNGGANNGLLEDGDGTREKGGATRGGEVLSS